MAEEYFKRSALHGNPEAQFNLGHLYSIADRTPEVPKKTLKKIFFVVLFLV